MWVNPFLFPETKKKYTAVYEKWRAASLHFQLFSASSIVSGIIWLSLGVKSQNGKKSTFNNRCVDFKLIGDVSSLFFPVTSFRSSLQRLHRLHKQGARRPKIKGKATRDLNDSSYLFSAVWVANVNNLRLEIQILQKMRTNAIFFLRNFGTSAPVCFFVVVVAAKFLLISNYSRTVSSRFPFPFLFYNHVCFLSWQILSHLLEQDNFCAFN